MENMAVIVDILLVALLIICTLDGRKKGFVKMVLAILAMIVSWIVAREYSEPVAQWFVETFVRERVTDSISQAITSNIGEGVQTVAQALPGYINAAIEQAGLSVNSLLSQAASTESIAEISEKIYSAAHNMIIMPAAKAVALFVVFALCNAVLSCFIGIINKIFKLPVLKTLNRWLGALLGAAKGVFAVGIICMILYLISSVAPETELAKAVEGSAVFNAVMTIADPFLNV